MSGVGEGGAASAAPDTLTPAQRELLDALTDARHAREQLDGSGLEHRALALAVSVDLSLAAAFLFVPPTNDKACQDATGMVRAALDFATREEEPQ